ncbi:MAG: DHH family phosphoesterase [candidate division WOR-3 bacterium]
MQQSESSGFRFPWAIKPVDEDLLRRLSRELRVSEVLARLLVQRGVNDETSARVWLNPSVRLLYPGYLLPDFEPAKERIFKAIENKETVLIWGHDDLDGITAVLTLYKILSGMQAKVKYYIPTKGKDKHGLDSRILKKYCEEGVKLVVTVDCGITNYKEIKEIKEYGVDVIVTDHHEVIDPLPEAIAIIDPKRPDACYPYPYLTGVGVALKLAMELTRVRLKISYEEFFSVQPDMFVLGTLGTIADRSPLTGENRIMVTLGLNQMEKTQLPAVAAVLRTLNFKPKEFTVADFLSELLPLFASASGIEGVERFLDPDQNRAEMWVRELAQKSQEWRDEAERTFDLAQKNLRFGDGIIFVQHKELSLRALGASASRLKDRYQVPVIVLGWRGDAWVGECRGMNGIDLMDLLRALSCYLVDYGGHKKAAGFTIKDEQVEAFIRSAEQFAHENFAPKITKENQIVADGIVPFNDFDPAVIKLAPFGEGNPQPVFISEPTELVRNRDYLSPASRPELLLSSGKKDFPIEPGIPVITLYTIDDLGRLTLLDYHHPSPSHHSES